MCHNHKHLLGRQRWEKLGFLSYIERHISNMERPLVLVLDRTVFENSLSSFSDGILLGFLPFCFIAFSFTSKIFRLFGFSQKSNKSGPVS